ncbi:MAG: hypothetical protein MT490_18510 [Sphingomonas sp.]|nr:hypothetical protein [Sphingomonas sp.]MCX8477784.1 hypothetical protein [Sphingomonas sp.]
MMAMLPVATGLSVLLRVRRPDPPAKPVVAGNDGVGGATQLQ